jgi:hypothetical protein
MCPSCWYRRNADIMVALDKARGWPYYYLRQTWFVPWWEDLHPRCVQRFKSYHSAYKLVAYTLNFDALGPVIDALSVKDDWGGELTYQLRGIFVADHLVQDKRVDENLPGQVEVFADPRSEESESVGIIDRSVCTDHDSMLDAWLNGAPDNTDMPGLNHPFYYKRHFKFSQYIDRFSKYSPAGRSWAKVKSIGAYHGEEEDREEEKGGQEEDGEEEGCQGIGHCP